MAIKKARKNFSIGIAIYMDSSIKKSKYNWGKIIFRRLKKKAQQERKYAKERRHLVGSCFLNIKL